jgi:hypothetical protein
MLIDWLTLRIPLDALPPGAAVRLDGCLSFLTLTDADGCLVWKQALLDIDKLRSDSEGLFWQVQGDESGKRWLAVGGSPASVAGDGLNVFGTDDIVAAAELLLGVASRGLGPGLPGYRAWQCRRIDVTENYALPDQAAVDVALSQLMVSDTARRKASVRTGNTVYWSPSSDRRRGKAYSKGRHLLYLARKRSLPVSADDLALSSRLLRLELSLCGRWCRELSGPWWALSVDRLTAEHRDFFQSLNLGCEVADMGVAEAVAEIMRCNGVTESWARSVFMTYCAIRQHGFEAARDASSRATWYRHLACLRAAGYTDAHMRAVNVLPFPRVRLVLAEPVRSWHELRAA